jgi:hypothetical protein
MATPVARVLSGAHADSAADVVVVTFGTEIEPGDGTVPDTALGVVGEADIAPHAARRTQEIGARRERHGLRIETVMGGWARRSAPAPSASSRTMTAT